MKIRSVAADLFHTDGQSDRHDEAVSLFLQFCESDYESNNNNNNNNNNTETQFIYRFSVTYSFPTLRKLSPASVITNLHILLSFPRSYLELLVRLLAKQQKPYIVYNIQGGSNMTGTDCV